MTGMVARGLRQWHTAGAAGDGTSAMTSLNILYVEDDQRAAAEVQQLAAERGDTVAWESTGSGGLLRAGMEEFDVIILDRMLGDIDGLTIIRRLRESGVGTPVLMLSALGRTSDRAEGLEAGADDYLAKPFEAPELLARINALSAQSSVIAAVPKAAAPAAAVAGASVAIDTILRAGPSSDATEVRTLRAGTELKPTGQRDGLFIEVEDNYGTKGWVSVEDLA